MPTQQLETCANCGRTIGKLETVVLFDGYGVCGACHEILNKQPAAPRGDESAVIAKGVTTGIFRVLFWIAAIAIIIGIIVASKHYMDAAAIDPNYRR